MIVNDIRVGYESVDSYGRVEWRVYITLAGARRWAHSRIGAHPEMGTGYAVSGDGVCRIMVAGALTAFGTRRPATLTDLFPART